MSELPEVRKLATEQLHAFDTDYLSPAMWAHTFAWIERTFPGGAFTFLDIGGGNGLFVDRLLERFPRAGGTILDNGESLLAINKPHPRKRLVNAGAERMDEVLGDGRFDLISLNWVLHHLVGKTYRECRRLQRAVLEKARGRLRPGGRINVFENLYEGRWLRPLPSLLIYQLTSCKPLAPVIRRMGANTAGCGVCFLGRAAWLETFREAKLRVDEDREYEDWPLSRLRRVALHIGRVRVGQFSLAAT